MHLASYTGRKLGTCVLWLFFLSIIFSSLTLARTGVGVGVAQIKPEKSLVSGTKNSLGLIPVINTGDTPHYYNLGITYNSGSSSSKPSSEWFSFNPQNFYLAPGQTQNVAVTLKLPNDASEGNYFAYIEANPVDTSSGSKVGIAAATKLEFEVKTPMVLGVFKSQGFLSKVFLGIIGSLSISLIIIFSIKERKRIFRFSKQPLEVSEGPIQSPKATEVVVFDTRLAGDS